MPYIGEFNVEEQSKPGQITHLVVGDVIHIDEDSFVTWTSPVRGRGKWKDKYFLSSTDVY